MFKYLKYLEERCKEIKRVIDHHFLLITDEIRDDRLKKLTI